ncbi:MAG TPA: FtsK/SpoIIIE domain-containing protein [Fluviicoccus sp.]|nr:FtsK/SpoIIIE domain-containing protein [Fluviicoccus sp.]
MINADSLHPAHCHSLPQLPPFWRLGVMPENGLPVLWPVDYRRGVLIQAGPKAAAQADRLLENCLLQLLLQSPVGHLRISLCDTGLQARFPMLESLQAQTHGRALQVVGDRQRIVDHVGQMLDKARNRQVILARENLPDWQSCLMARRTAEPVEILVVAGLWGDAGLLENLRELCVSGGRLGILPVLTVTGSLTRFMDSAQQSLVEELADSIRQASAQLHMDKDGRLDIRDDQLGLIADLYRFFSPAVESYPEKIARQAVARIVAGLQLAAIPEDPEDFLSIPVGFHNGRVHHFALGAAVGAYHALIGGSAGGGKTSFLQMLVARLCRQYPPAQLRLFLFDYKDGFSFGLFGDLAQVELLHQEPRERAPLRRTLEAFEREMDRRAALFREAGPLVSRIEAYNSGDRTLLPRWLLVVDEIQGAFGSAPPDEERLQALLREVMRRGHTFGLHAILTTQSCTDSRLDAATRAQMRLKIGFRPGNSDESAALFGRMNEAALSLPPHQAIFNLRDGDAEGNIRVMVDHLPEMPDLARALNDARKRYPLVEEVPS